MLRLPVEVKGKYGYVDGDGEISIPLQYDTALEFAEGLAVVWRTNGNVHEIIDMEGDVQGEFLKAGTFSHFSEGLVDFFESEDGATPDGDEGYLDARGRVVISPRFSTAGPFADGLALVEIDDKWGVISPQGDWVIEPRFDSLRPFGKSEATTPFEQDEQWGFINRDGEVVLEPRYREAMLTYRGLTRMALPLWA
jgi:hypothetical protein